MTKSNIFVPFWHVIMHRQIRKRLRCDYVCSEVGTLGSMFTVQLLVGGCTRVAPRWFLYATLKVLSC